jgi:hypothetical protein
MAGHSSWNISDREHFKRCMIGSSRDKVMLCWQISSRYGGEGGRPTFLENLA